MNSHISYAPPPPPARPESQPRLPLPSRSSPFGVAVRSPSLLLLRDSRSNFKSPLSRLRHWRVLVSRSELAALLLLETRRAAEECRRRRHPD
ncbi:hypothetical protein AAHA92_16904 [Salvia divinorum]|uniref:Uncharacterized protein n=1 Tax=Salvia divinorum TaxID=28513 RepID=A0ABD1GXK9_SALDI